MAAAMAAAGTAAAAHLLSLAMAYGFMDLLARRNFSRKMGGAFPFCASAVRREESIGGREDDER